MQDKSNERRGQREKWKEKGEKRGMGKKKRQESWCEINEQCKNKDVMERYLRKDK